jgi:hypothetical protein
MNDTVLQELLILADERFGPMSPVDQTPDGNAALVHAVRRCRRRQTWCRTALGVLAVFVLAGGVWAGVARFGLFSNNDRMQNAIAFNPPLRPTAVPPEMSHQIQPTSSQLSEDEINRLQAQIAELENEANRALQFVELYRAAESRHKVHSASEALAAESLLPTEVIAELEIDRAAAISVISADAQANEFNRPDEAAESYRSVLKHFPESRWASVARERLAQVRHMN